MNEQREQPEGHETVQDSEWETLHKLKNGSLQFVSKFLVSGLAISSETLRSRWDTFSTDEKYAFARAYSAKPSLTAADDEILNFLMENGDSVIWISIAPLLTRHQDRDRVLSFLLDNIHDLQGPKANFFQAIESLGDVRAVSTLRLIYLEFSENTRSREKIDRLDFLQCCRALLALDGAMEYEDRLKSFLFDPDEDVRKWAQRFLAEEREL
jgi:hypothetical protein